MIVIHFVWIHIIINIFGSEEDGALTAADLTTCSYTTAALLRVNAEHHYSATTTTTTIKNDKKNTHHE